MTNAAPYCVRQNPGSCKTSVTAGWGVRTQSPQEKAHRPSPLGGHPDTEWPGIVPAQKVPEWARLCQDRPTSQSPLPEITARCQSVTGVLSVRARQRDRRHTGQAARTGDTLRLLGGGEGVGTQQGVYDQRLITLFAPMISWQPARFMSHRELNVTGIRQPPNAPFYEVLPQVNEQT